MRDFLVVGGGIAGVSAAAHLAPHGSVTLLEMEPSLAYHTSGRSAAMLVENYGSAGSRPLVRASRPFLTDPPAGSVESSLLADRAVMWVADERGLTQLEAKAAAGRQTGAVAEILDTAGVVAKMPVMRTDWVAGGLFDDSGADIDVAALHQAFVRIARRHDAEIHTGSPVTAIERDGAAWMVNASERSIRTRMIINAAGAWGDVIADLAGIAPIGLQPYRRTAFMVPGDAGSANWPMIVEVNERWYLRPDGVQYLCSLAEEVASEPMDARPRMEDVALAIERINQATTLGIRTVNSQWSGLRTFAPDRDLVIGEDPTAPGFYWLVGQGGIGIQTSPAYGALIADLATTGEVSESLVAAGVDHHRTSPARFRDVARSHR